MSGFVGFGRADRCPNCGSETKNADDEGVRICLACGETHRRDEAGRWVVPINGRLVSVAALRDVDHSMLAAEVGLSLEEFESQVAQLFGG